MGRFPRKAVSHWFRPAPSAHSPHSVVQLGLWVRCHQRVGMTLAAVYPPYRRELSTLESTEVIHRRGGPRVENHGVTEAMHPARHEPLLRAIALDLSPGSSPIMCRSSNQPTSTHDEPLLALDLRKAQRHGVVLAPLDGGPGTVKTSAVHVDQVKVRASVDPALRFQRLSLSTGRVVHMRLTDSGDQTVVIHSGFHMLSQKLSTAGSPALRCARQSRAAVGRHVSRETRYGSS
jgi:hypothetical protein